jgi:hypothetical protein
MTMPDSTLQITLRIRNRLSSTPWAINNFGWGGWRVRSDDNTQWFRMVPENTRVVNPNYVEGDPEDDPINPKWLKPVEIDREA